MKTKPVIYPELAVTTSRDCDGVNRTALEHILKMAVSIRDGNYLSIGNQFSLMDTDLAFPLAQSVFTIF